MRIAFNTYRPTQFRGLHDALNRIQSQINAGGIPTRDGFTPVQDGGTVIIENYYESGKDKTDFSKLGNGRGTAATEGAVSGATTGGAIEGTKTIAKKIKNSGEDVEKPNDSAVDADDATSIDLLGDDNNIDAGNKKSIDEKLEVSESNADDSISTENSDDFTDIDNEIDIEPDVELDPDIDIEPDVDIEPDIDIDLFD